MGSHRKKVFIGPIYIMRLKREFVSTARHKIDLGREPAPGAPTDIGSLDAVAGLGH